MIQSFQLLCATLSAFSFVITLSCSLCFEVASAQFANGEVTDPNSAAAVGQEDPAVPVATGSPQSIRAAVAINFDTTNEPCFFKSTTALREAFSSLGVHFTGPGALDGGGILNECGGFGVTGHSSPNFLAYNTATDFSDGGVSRGPQTITFDTRVDSVSIRAGHSLAGTVTLDAFGNGNIQVDSDSISSTSSLQTMSVSASAITKVVISFTGSVLVVDNLNFNTIPPAPTATPWGLIATFAALAMMGSVMLAVVR